jgi:transcriptional regulator with XRE-family HTH domain
MARNFSELRDKMSPERIARSDARVKKILAKMRLKELRRARELSQQSIADDLGMDQGNVSKLEQRTDMYISTLRRYIEALGGSLEIVARFPGGDVKISQFHEL